MKRCIRTPEVLAAVCAELALDPSEVLGRSLHARAVLARGLVSSLARRLTGQSWPEIAADLNRGNHSTCMTASRRIERLLQACVLVEPPAAPRREPLADLVERVAARIEREATP